GNGALSYSVAASSEAAPRIGHLAIGGRLVTIAQQAVASSPCTFSVWPAGWVAPGNGGTFTFDVQQFGGCAWFTATDATASSWLQVSGDSGNVAVDGTVTYTLTANSDQAHQRSAVIHINAGSPGSGTTEYVVTQDVASGGGGFGPGSGGPPVCEYHVTPFEV